MIGAKIRIGNPVLLALALTFAAALTVGGFVSHATNRLVSGRSFGFFAIAPAPVVVACVGLGAILIAMAFLRPRPILQWMTIAVAFTLSLVLFLALAGAAADLTGGGAVARSAPAGGFYLALPTLALMIVDALQRLRAGVIQRLLAAAVALVAAAGVLASGVLDPLSIVQEYRHRSAAFMTAFDRHCLLAGTAVGIALLIGIPLGILAVRRPALAGPLFASLNFLQTVPSIALFGLLIGPLGAIGIGGIGVAPALIALTLYSLLPIVRNTHAGIGGVDPAIVESAAGSGFTPRQILRRVELPLAAPVLLAGVRIVAVQAIGLTVVAALIGAGGLGTFVFQGLGQYATDLILLGALPTIFLALAADFLLRTGAALFARRGSR